MEFIRVLFLSACPHQRVIGALRRDRTRFGKGNEREIGPVADGAHPGIAKPADFLFEPGPPPEIVGAAAADERLVGKRGDCGRLPGGGDAEGSANLVQRLDNGRGPIAPAEPLGGQAVDPREGSRHQTRSEESRVRKECVRPCIFRWSSTQSKKNTTDYS